MKSASTMRTRPIRPLALAALHQNLIFKDNALSDVPGPAFYISLFGRVGWEANRGSQFGDAVGFVFESS
jgi:hypothetical protein